MKRKTRLQHNEHYVKMDANPKNATTKEPPYTIVPNLRIKTSLLKDMARTVGLRKASAQTIVETFLKHATTL